MSDDRMDRAARIRNMREGNRGTDDDQPDDDTPATAPSEEQPSAGEQSSPASVDDTTANESVADSGLSQPTTGSDDSPSDAASSGSRTGAAAADADQSRTDAGSATDAANEATTAAQRAAAAAAEVTETGVVAESEPTGGTANDTTAETPDVPAGATGAGTVPGDVSGVQLPDQELLEAAMATSSVESESTEGGARAAMGEESTGSEEVVRVLEFSLGDEFYCLDIEYVEEIVKRDAVTRVPNTPPFVDGVVDLRGQITTILEPKEMMDIDSEGEQDLIIVFDPDQFEDQGAIGWVVDEVRQVVPVTESEINTPPVDAAYINGVVDRAEYEQFVIWVEPEDALAQATAPDED